jgi:HPt (histidine-containing phosphotransfer) domain-containing protein
MPYDPGAISIRNHQCVWRVVEMVVERIDSDLMELVPRFLDNARMDFEEVVRARSAHDLTTLARIGHSLKGAGAGFGFRVLAEIGTMLEQGAKESNFIAVDSQIAAFAAYLSSVRVEPV